MRLLTGREEIICLLKKVVARYELITGQEVVRNTNRKNYEELAKVLSDISNKLPETSTILEHDSYAPDLSAGREFPYRKYDITAGQVKDAYAGIVGNPRPFLVDACYIYLFGKGRKGFEKNPEDPEFFKDPEPSEKKDTTLYQQEQEALKLAILNLQKEKEQIQTSVQQKFKKEKRALQVRVVILFAVLLLLVGVFIYHQRKWADMKADMKILPYQPTAAEIDQLEGIWLCYTGSPQARSSEKNRYHMIVANVLDIKYKNGYFTFNRYGASFDHYGYMQFEAPYLVSSHSIVKNSSGSIEFPRHSLMPLDTVSPYINAISASWNFDIAEKKEIIGIREVFIKQGKGGSVEEVINTIENASCHCKIIRWQQANDSVQSFYLRNFSLDSLKDESIKKLVDEKSIILRQPREGIIIADTNTIKKL